MELGRVGLWSRHFWSEQASDLAAQAERLGYGTLWYPNGQQIFERARLLLEATQRVVIATGIASIWTYSPEEAAAGHRRLSHEFPDRFLLGLGVSHAHLVDRDQPGRYSQPLTRMTEYLDALDREVDAVPPEERILAALGPKMLALAAQRSAGAHPYLGPVEHTRRAREVLGPGPILAPEMAAVLETNPGEARAVARAHLGYYMRAPNYLNNWRRFGYGDGDFGQGGSDRLVDALVAWGDAQAIRERVDQHFEAGADHVCLQVLRPDQSPPLDEWRQLAAALRLETA